MKLEINKEKPSAVPIIPLKAAWTDAFWVIQKSEPETLFSPPVGILNLHRKLQPLMLMYNYACCTSSVSFGWLMWKTPFLQNELFAVKSHICKPNFPRREIKMWLNMFDWIQIVVLELYYIIKCGILHSYIKNTSNGRCKSFQGQTVDLKPYQRFQLSFL